MSFEDEVIRLPRLSSETAGLTPAKDLLQALITYQARECGREST
jgi:hypothetical protein